MNKHSTLLCCALIISAMVMAQAEEETGPKTEKIFYAELGGPGVLFSANFDTRFKKETRLGWGVRFGIGFTVVEKEDFDPQNGYYDYKTESIATIPFGLNYVFGKKTNPNTFEVGFGGTVLTKKASVYSYDDDYNEGNFIGHFSFMYRRVPADGGFSWRIGFVPVINTDGQIFPSAAVGLGYAFK